MIKDFLYDERHPIMRDLLQIQRQHILKKPKDLQKLKDNKSFQTISSDYASNNNSKDNSVLHRNFKLMDKLGHSNNKKDTNPFFNNISLDKSNDYNALE